jgi:hypothetical protein
MTRQIKDLRQLAREEKIAIHIVMRAPKAFTRDTGKIRPIHVNGELGEVSDYCICVARSPYLANLKRGKARNNKDFDAADIVAANACTPYVEADSHVILAVDKVKRPGVMGHPGVYAFAYDVVRNDVIFDAGATMLVRKIWSV